jgi:chemotaxis protein methyltransferase CheR
MNLLNYTNITITEYRNILKAIKDTYGFDFNDFALISLKRRIECFMFANRFATADKLISYLTENKNFIQVFLKEVIVESTEMFRDPSFWRYLRNSALPKLMSENKTVRIVFPNCVSGDDLYSFCILIRESNWENHFEIYAITLDNIFKANIEKGTFSPSKIEVSTDNYQRFEGLYDLSRYYTMAGEVALRDSSLVQKVHFLQQNFNLDNLPENINFIIYRNQLLYFTQTLHDKMLKLFYNKLSTNGYLAIGIKEQLGITSQNLYKTVNETERVFIKNQ